MAKNSHGRASFAPGGEAKDPVCGMKVDPAVTKWSTPVEGKPFYFCSAHCLEKFRTEPSRYVGKPGEPSTSSAGKTGHGSYVCPMHAQIVRDAPGACPICGMALEPLTVAAEEEPN